MKVLRILSFMVLVSLILISEYALTAPNPIKNPVQIKPKTQRKIKTKPKKKKKRSQGKPDLAITRILTNPPIPYQVKPFTISIEVRNLGSYKAPASQISCYFGRKHKLFGDYELQTTINLPSILPGGKKTADWQIRVPYKGKYKYSFSIELPVSAKVTESNEKNNKKEGYMPVHPGPLPDLWVKSISVSPANPGRKHTITYTATVTNIGAITTSVEPVVEFHLVQGRDTIFKQEQTIAKLPTRTVRNVSYIVLPPPGGHEPGPYYITVTIYMKGPYSEYSMENNIKTVSYKVIF